MRRSEDSLPRAVASLLYHPGSKSQTRTRPLDGSEDHSTHGSLVLPDSDASPLASAHVRCLRYPREPGPWAGEARRVHGHGRSGAGDGLAGDGREYWYRRGSTGYWTSWQARALRSVGTVTRRCMRCGNILRFNGQTTSRSHTCAGEPKSGSSFPAGHRAFPTRSRRSIS